MYAAVNEVIQKRPRPAGVAQVEIVRVSFLSDFSCEWCYSDGLLLMPYKEPKTNAGKWLATMRAATSMSQLMLLVLPLDRSVLANQRGIEIARNRKEERARDEREELRLDDQGGSSGLALTSAGNADRGASGGGDRKKKTSNANNVWSSLPKQSVKKLALINHARVLEDTDVPPHTHISVLTTGVWGWHAADCVLTRLIATSILLTSSHFTFFSLPPSPFLPSPFALRPPHLPPSVRPAVGMIVNAKFEEEDGDYWEKGLVIQTDPARGQVMCIYDDSNDIGWADFPDEGS